MSDSKPSYIERYEERFGLVQENVEEVASLRMSKLEYEGFEFGNWVNPDARDGFRYAFINQNGVEAFVDLFENGEEKSADAGTIRLSPLHAVVWTCEILGQISDGAWENYWGPDSGTAWDAWEWYWDLNIEVDDEIDGVEFDVSDSPPSTTMDVAGHLTKYDEHVARIAFYMSAVIGTDIDENRVRSVLSDFDDALENAKSPVSTSL